MDLLYYLLSFVLLLTVVALMVYATYHSKIKGREEVFKEINRNKKTIEMLWYVINENKRILNTTDRYEIFKHSEGFLIRSVKDITDEAYVKNNKYFDEEENLELKNLYKAFGVVSNVLAFVSKVNKEEEVNKFFTNFNTSSQLVVQLANKVLNSKKSIKEI